MTRFQPQSYETNFNWTQSIMHTTSQHVATQCPVRSTWGKGQCLDVKAQCQNPHGSRFQGFLLWCAKFFWDDVLVILIVLTVIVLISQMPFLSAPVFNAVQQRQFYCCFRHEWWLWCFFWCHAYCQGELLWVCVYVCVCVISRLYLHDPMHLWHLCILSW